MHRWCHIFAEINLQRFIAKKKITWNEFFYAHFSDHPMASSEENAISPSRLIPCLLMTDSQPTSTYGVHPSTRCIMCRGKFVRNDIIVSQKNQLLVFAHISCVAVRCPDCGFFAGANEKESFTIQPTSQLCDVCQFPIVDPAYLRRQNGTIIHFHCSVSDVDGGKSVAVFNNKQ